MADRRDDLDSWLSERIDPLPPPPGTFELIKRRARRRRYRKLAITATSAALIVAAAVTVPQVVNLHVLNPSSGSAAAAGRTSSATSTGGGRAESSGSARPSPTATPSSAPAVPANFRPTSVTFVSAGTGWVIGQAGTPGRCATRYCTSVARTDDGGETWSGVPAPVTGPADGATGVSQIRFLNLNDGWAFGPGLWATHNGGQTWTPVSTGGLRVTDLETVGNRVFALFASCAGSGASFAAGCTSFTLYSAPASGGGNWAPVGASTSGLTDGAAGEAASLVLTGSRGFLLAPGRELYSGPVGGGGPWTLVNSITPSCPVGAAQADGQPAGALFGAVNATELILACGAAAEAAATERRERRERAAEADVLLAERRGQLDSDRPGAHGGDRHVGGRQPGRDHRARHGSGHRRAARRRHRLAGGDPERLRAARRVQLRRHDHRLPGHRAARQPRVGHRLVHLQRRADLAASTAQWLLGGSGMKSPAVSRSSRNRSKISVS